jgi:asparagine synthase (glutamine-hydrolysing)
MCGIAGFFASGHVAHLRGAARVRSMLRAQAHRGPDGAGLTAWDAAGGAAGGGWVSTYAPEPAALTEPPARQPVCVLGHNLLAIQDLTPAARQPMIGGVGGSPPDVALAFNGEIYNFVELRAALERQGERFETRGDTEVLLRLWRRDGAACLPSLRGMFAFAAFDARERRLWLVRDLFGIKPLYYARTPEGLCFASEIRSLHACGAVRRALRDSAVVACAAAGVNKFGDAETLYDGVHELPPGHWLTAGPDGAVRVEQYEDLPEVVPELSGPEAAEMLAAGVRESVTLHLRSSRRLATCLSGGLDSTNLAWLVGEHAARAGRSYDTFTVCTAGPEDSELASAALVAERAGLRHHILTPPEIHAADVLEMAIAYESPNHVVGPINQFLLLRRVAEEGVTVVLDGQGGDELLSGYPWFVPTLLNDMESRGADTSALRAQLATRLPLPPETMAQFTRMFHDANAWVEAFIWQGEFLGWSRDAVAALPATQYYLHGGGDWRLFRRREYRRAELQYLLRQEDRLGMWFGLECRVPFVDRPLVQLASRLTPEYLIHDGYLKYPFRVMLPDVPDRVRWETRKRGFWETDRARFNWVADAGKRLASSSDTLRRVFPTLPEKWDGLSFDQHWRLLQLAALERCATREEIPALLADAGITTGGAP